MTLMRCGACHINLVYTLLRANFILVLLPSGRSAGAVGHLQQSVVAAHYALLG